MSDTLASSVEAGARERFPSTRAVAVAVVHGSQLAGI